MNGKRSYMVTIIGDITIFGALLSIAISIFPDLTVKLGLHKTPLPIFSNEIMSIILPITILLAAFGYLKLKKWGYWLLVIYSVFFLIVNIVSCLQNYQKIYSTNLFFTIFSLIFLIPTIRYFYGTDKSHSC